MWGENQIRTLILRELKKRMDCCCDGAGQFDTTTLSPPVDDPGDGPTILFNPETGEFFYWFNDTWNLFSSGGGSACKQYKVILSADETNNPIVLSEIINTIGEITWVKIDNTIVEAHSDGLFIEGQTFLNLGDFDLYDYRIIYSWIDENTIRLSAGSQNINVVLNQSNDEADGFINNMISIEVCDGIATDPSGGTLTCQDVLECINVDGVTITGDGSVGDPFVASVGTDFYFEVTKAEADTLIGSDGLVKGATYKITDRGDRGIFLDALKTDLFSKEGKRLMLCPADYAIETDVNGNIWKGVWHIAKTVNSGELMIWGGQVWKNGTGSIGTASDDFTLDGTNWGLINKSSFSAGEYIEMQFSISYDYTNDWIERQWDQKDNILGYTHGEYINENIFGPNPVDMSDWNMGTISLASFIGADYFVHNHAVGIYNNTATFLYANYIMDVDSASKIVRNRCSRIFANKNRGSIADNNTEIIIAHNSNIGVISGNTCQNDISYNSNVGHIWDNSNAGAINANNNKGNINLNSNGGSILLNCNLDTINENSNGGDISYNSNSGLISSNTISGFIQFNRNNGDITGNTGTANILENINNGDIGPAARIADVNDVAVNK